MREANHKKSRWVFCADDVCFSNPLYSCAPIPKPNTCALPCDTYTELQRAVSLSTGPMHDTFMIMFIPLSHVRWLKASPGYRQCAVVEELNESPSVSGSGTPCTSCYI